MHHAGKQEYLAAALTGYEAGHEVDMADTVKVVLFTGIHIHRGGKKIISLVLEFADSQGRQADGLFIRLSLVL